MRHGWVLAAMAAFGLLAAESGHAQEHHYGHRYLVTAGVGIPASVGDYGDETDPKLSIPINLTGRIHGSFGWIASYSFNKLKAAGEDLVDCTASATCRDITVHHFGAGPMLTTGLGSTHLYAGVELGVDSVGPYETDGERTTSFAVSPAAALVIPIAHSAWSVAAQLYVDRFHAKQDDGTRRWNTYVTPSVAIGYGFGK